MNETSEVPKSIPQRLLDWVEWVAGGATTESGDGRRHRQLAFHGQSDLHHHDRFFRHRRGLRRRREDHLQRGGRHRRGDEDLLRPGGLLLLFIVISQFVAYFNYSNIGTVLAVSMAQLLKEANLGAVPLLLMFILIGVVLCLPLPAILPKWAVMAPIFVPLFLKLGIGPG